MPDSALDPFFPNRRAWARDWARVWDAAERRRPPLGIPWCGGWSAWGLVLTSLILIFWGHFADQATWLLCGVLGIVGGPATLLFAVSGLVQRNVVRGRIPARFKTVRDLIPHSLSPVGDRSQAREVVAARVKEIVLEQLGLAEANYSEDADFVRDLGVG